MSTGSPPDITSRLGVPPGLCASCAHAQVVETARHSVFLRCRLSSTDARFPRYPRLPVLSCPGFASADDAETIDRPETS